jgi:hypothetical protein
MFNYLIDKGQFLQANHVLMLIIKKTQDELQKIVFFPFNN